MRYNLLRSELALFRNRFREAAIQWPDLQSRRVWDAEEVTVEGWDFFARRNLLGPGLDARVLADGQGIVCYSGCDEAVAAFDRLADSAWLVLACLEDAHPDAQVILGSSGYAAGWVEAVYETACGAMTPLLRVDCERWGLPETEDLDALNELHPAYWSGTGNNRYPNHPRIQTLAHDLFTSSAEAIRVWLEPESIATVDDRLDGVPIRLPCIRELSTLSPSPAGTVVTLSDELTPRQAAGYLGVSVDTLGNYVRAGLLSRRNTSPPGSGKPRYRYKVAELDVFKRQGYHRMVPSAPAPRNRPKQRPSGFTSKHLDLD